MMGTWAEAHVPGLSSEEMDQYEALLNAETIDIFNYVTGKAEAPEAIKSPLLDRLQVGPVAAAAHTPLAGTRLQLARFTLNSLISNWRCVYGRG